ncbi:Thioredoxin [hydrothermal vent metagenome]|uniref:Thioredoxin n=1 Tax=hydrothermal vent metagenome TaxID=652676 RepID=A0A3B1C1L6_9ZZZZ
MSHPIDVDDSTFETEVLKSDKPVLVDFWAEWCGPCRMVGPMVEEIAGDYNGKLKVAKVNTDQSQQVPAKYGIRGIPTLILFHKGEVVDQIVGAVPKDAIEELVKKAVT